MEHFGPSLMWSVLQLALKFHVKMVLGTSALGELRGVMELWMGLGLLG